MPDASTTCQTSSTAALLSAMPKNNKRPAPSVDVVQPQQIKQTDATNLSNDQASSTTRNYLEKRPKIY